MVSTVLDRFSEPTRAWFETSFATPTAAQIPTRRRKPTPIHRATAKQIDMPSVSGTKMKW